MAMANDVKLHTQQSACAAEPHWQELGQTAVPNHQPDIILIYIYLYLYVVIHNVENICPGFPLSDASCPSTARFTTSVDVSSNGGMPPQMGVN